MLVNEHLEAELNRLYTVISCIDDTDVCFETLH